MILGVHAPVRGGYAAALSRAETLGCEALQILPYPRHHAPTDEELASFRAARAGSAVRRLLVHSRFVPSLASSDRTRRERSVEHLARELSLCARLGGDAYVLHAGAYSPGADAAAGARLFAESVAAAAGRADFGGPLLLENVPGGGRRMGGTLEELARLQEALAPRVPALGVCLDTAHAWAAGYDVASAEGALKLIARTHRLLGFDALRAFHLNDTRALMGSRLESHERWGRGRLGRDGARALLSREEFADAPGIVEPPPGSVEEDAADLAFVRAAAS